MVDDGCGAGHHCFDRASIADHPAFETAPRDAPPHCCKISRKFVGV